MKLSSTKVVAACACFSEFASAITTVAVKGNAFFAGNQRFYLRGLDYQPGGDSGNKDPLADIDGCKRDIVEFQKLGINTIRTYTIDNSASHDDCMKLLSDAGIYVAVDVSWSKYSLNREYPEAMRRSYNDVYLQSVFATMDSFAKYDNLLAFFAANEVITKNETWSAPFIKAQIRDMKQYITSRKYRNIPVGYAATDVPDTHYQIATYLNCGPDDVRTDFVAFNDYSWCGPQSFADSSWSNKTQLFGNYSAPIFFSEYGCIEVQPRTFTDVAPLYSANMTPVYSGGLIYEYSFEKIIFDKAGFGIVDINGNTVSERPDFTALQTAFKNSAIPKTDGGYSATNKPSLCPAETAQWKANASLPVMPQGAAKFMTNGAGAGPGFKDQAGSQWKGTASNAAWVPIGANSAGGNSTSPSATPPKKSAGTLNVLPNVQFLVLGMTLLYMF